MPVADLEKPKLRWGTRVLLLVTLGVVSIGILEIGLRLLWENPFRAESPAHYVWLRVPHANSDLRVDVRSLTPENPTVRLRTDARSYILPSRRFENPDRTIAFLGGSTTECSAVPEAERFPALVSELLEEQGHRVNSLNSGWSGNTAHDSLNALVNHVNADVPDIAVLMHAANDIGVLMGKDNYRSRGGQITTWRPAARWLAQRLSSESSLVAALRQAARLQAPRMFNPPAPPEVDPVVDPGPFEQRLRAFVGVARAFGITPILMTQPTAEELRNELSPGWMSAQNQSRFNDSIRDVAASEDAMLIDLARHVPTVEGWNQPMTLFYDGMHVTAAGSRIYAEYITRALLESDLL